MKASRERLFRLAFWVIAGSVLVLSLLPQDVPLPSSGWDKFNHLIAYQVLAVTGFLAYPRRMMGVAFGVIAYSGVIELLQAFSGYRFGDWLDLLANSVGVLLGWGSWHLIRLVAAGKAVVGAGAMNAGRET